MLFELKSVFQNDGEEKQVEYNLDLSGLDVDGVYPFKTPVVVTAKATNRASLITLVINAHFDYSRDCDRCGEPYTREMNMSFEHRLIQTLADEENDDYIETPDFTLELDDVVISDIFFRSRQRIFVGTIAKVYVRFADKTSTTVNVPVISVKRIQDLRYLNS